jgi:amino acid permease
MSENNYNFNCMDVILAVLFYLIILITIIGGVTSFINLIRGCGC